MVLKMITKISNWIKSLFNNLELETRPVLTSEQIEDMFPNLIKGFHAGDDGYNTTTYESMENFIKLWFVKHKKWTNKFDCDNFSDAFMGWAKLTNPTKSVGTIWVKQSKNQAHALNFCVFHIGKNKFEWAYIEPQTGEIFRLTNKKVLNWIPFYVRI